MPKKTVLPAHQARSRESLKRLLNATIEVLDKDGLEGATIPRIAARAGVSPGTVYRRFPDKDALMREVCLRVYESNYRHTQELFSRERWEDKSLEEIAGSMIRFTLKGHREHRGLVRALLFFIFQHPEAAFVRKCEELETKVLQEISELLLSRLREIHHPHPETAVKFAMLMIPVMATGILVLPPDPKDFNRFLPNIESHLEEELPRMFLRFLGVNDGHERRA
jgi:AcrR family transcriptional regulator